MEERVKDGFMADYEMRIEQDRAIERVREIALAGARKNDKRETTELLDKALGDLRLRIGTRDAARSERYDQMRQTLTAELRAASAKFTELRAVVIEACGFGEGLVHIKAHVEPWGAYSDLLARLRSKVPE